MAEGMDYAGRKGTFESDENICCLDCGDGLIVKHVQADQIVYFKCVHLKCISFIFQ